MIQITHIDSYIDKTNYVYITFLKIFLNHIHMSGAHFTKVLTSPEAYNQYKSDDVVTKSIYDLNMSCDPSLRFQNKIIFIVDSKDRQPTEEPNKYSIKFPTIFKDVISVELKNSNIPNSEYIINDYNNMFYFQDSHNQINNDRYHTI